MEDTEMLDQQLPQASLVDTGVQQQQSSHPIEGQHTTGTRHSPHSGTADDNTLTLPTDVNMSDKPDNKSSNDADTNSCDAAPGQPLEKKNNGDAAPFPCAESFTPKSGPKHVEKSKSWLLDPEVHKKRSNRLWLNHKSVNYSVYPFFFISMFCCFGYRWVRLMKLEHRRSKQHL